MVENILISKFLMDLMPEATSASGEEDTIKRFAGTVKDIFGIDSVNVTIFYEKNGPNNAVAEYLVNTRKAYVDNQLSEYSAFPELINYKNQGFMSAAFLPIIAHGKVLAMLEMLSSRENKFSEDLVGSVAIGAAFIGFALAYKVETGRNIKLAGYFDSAFGSDIPQFLVAASGAIVKANKAALKAFPLLPSSQNIASVLGADFARLSQLVNGKSATMRLDVNGVETAMRVSSSRVSDSLLHVVAEDVTDANRFRSLIGALNPGSDIAVMVLGSDMTIKGVFGSLGSRFAESRGSFTGRKVTDIFAKPSAGASPVDVPELGAVQQGAADLLLPNESRIRVHYTFYNSQNFPLFVMANADLEKYVAGLKDDLYDFVDTTSDIVLMADDSGYVTDCNISVERTLGYAKEELVGKSIRDVYSDVDVLEKDMAYVRSGGRIDNTYVNLFKKNGETIPATHSIRQLRSANGPSYMLLIKELWTKSLLADQVKGLRERDAQIKNLKQASDLKSQFIYNISHELKTPLTNIKGFAKLMYEGDFGSLSDEQKEYLKTILDESDRLMLIITQVLDAAKLEAQKVKLEPKEVSLRDLAENPSIKALEEMAQNKGLSFAWNVGYDVPNIMADPNRLIQVFVNLIGNSIKFTEKGGITVQVSRKSRKFIQCSVADTGIGISDEDKKKIFRKFYQAQKKSSLVKPDGTGTGLGLSITKDIVSLHGGKITFESQPGKGTTFTVLLPIVPKERKKGQ